MQLISAVYRRHTWQQTIVSLYEGMRHIDMTEKEEPKEVY
jgi:hypothetical protein